MIFVATGLDMKTVDLFFQGYPPSHPLHGHYPMKDYKFNIFQPTETLAHIMHRAGIFPSVGQARKNGWNKEIPIGFSEFKVGKKQTEIFVLNWF